MNIQLNNFGPIKQFDFDLSKDLTVLFGKTNTGKTYAISAIYLVLKAFSNAYTQKPPIDAALFYYVRGVKLPGYENSSTMEHIRTFEDSVKKEMIQKDEFDVTSAMQKIFTGIISDMVLPSLEKSFTNSFASLESLQNKFSSDRLSIKIQFNIVRLTTTVVKGKMTVTNLTFTQPIIIRKGARSFKAEKKDDRRSLYYYDSQKKQSNVVDHLVLGYYQQFKDEISSGIKNLYFLPACRAGFYQTFAALNPIIAELSKKRSSLSSAKIDFPNISEPVSDYFLALASIYTKVSSRKYSKIVKGIESKILGGAVLFDAASRKLMFSPEKSDQAIDFSFASSMISEVGPLAAFFKYIISDFTNEDRHRSSLATAAPGQHSGSHIIFIEEPEAHLHPELQVKLMELFCEALKYDIKIVMTSHSNYMHSKLSNLILDKAVSPRRVGAYLMILGKDGSVTDSLAMAADEEGLRDKNFVNVSEELYNERVSIYSKLNQPNN
jgi:AAA15 family ATPase/GTPase